jgi:hypothetical protein
MSALSPEVDRFIRRHIRSVWDLELLLLLSRDPSRVWIAPELVRELRASILLVSDSLMTLKQASCIAEEPSEHYRYQPASAEVEAQVQALKDAYANFPVAVTKLIWEGPHSRIQVFADAFRLKKD